MRVALLPAIAVAFCILVATPPAGAQETVSASQRLARAKLCYEALDYSCAEQELTHARAAMEALDPAGRIGVLQLSAESALSMGKQEQAHTHLMALLKADPSFQPPPKSWSKPWLDALAAARRASPDRLPPTLEVSLPIGPVPSDEVLVLELQATDRSGVSGVKLFLVTGPSFDCTTSDGQTWHAKIPAEHVVGEELLLWIEARDQPGNGPARWGSPRAPKRIPIAQKVTSDSVATKWWFWTIIGGTVAVAAATGITVWLLTQEDEPPAPTTATGGIDVRFVWPTP